MARLKIFNAFSNLTPVEFVRYCSAFIADLLKEFNGNIQFQKNIKSSDLVTVSFSGSSDVQSVSHTLGSVPRGTLIIRYSAAQNVYKPSGAQYEWTNGTIYLQASGAIDVDLYII